MEGRQISAKMDGYGPSLIQKKIFTKVNDTIKRDKKKKEEKVEEKQTFAFFPIFNYFLI